MTWFLSDILLSFPNSNDLNRHALIRQASQNNVDIVLKYESVGLSES